MEFGPNAEVQTCGTGSASQASIESLNETCYCLSVDTESLRRGLEADLGEHGLPAATAHAHAHLFAALPVFVARRHLQQMAHVIEAVEKVVETRTYRQAVLAWAPEIAHFDPGTHSGLLGYDFHLTDAGPKLIEINTNPGGAFLNGLLGRALRPCCPGSVSLESIECDFEEALLNVFLTEWRLQRGSAALGCVAIVDAAPAQQYLYPEFLLFQELLRKNGIEAVICDPRELESRLGHLCYQERQIDFVYNRLTDFSLQSAAHAVLRASYLAGEVVVSPHPRAHALFADKRNLTLLCDGEFLRAAGLADNLVATLLDAVPLTQVMTADNRDAMWSNRRRLFSSLQPGMEVRLPIAARSLRAVCGRRYRQVHMSRRILSRPANVILQT